MLQLEVIGNLGADATIREFNGQVKKRINKK